MHHAIGSYRGSAFKIGPARPTGDDVEGASRTGRLFRCRRCTRVRDTESPEVSHVDGVVFRLGGKIVAATVDLAPLHSAGEHSAVDAGPVVAAWLQLPLMIGVAEFPSIRPASNRAFPVRPGRRAKRRKPD